MCPAPGVRNDRRRPVRAVLAGKIKKSTWMQCAGDVVALRLVTAFLSKKLKDLGSLDALGADGHVEIVRQLNYRPDDSSGFVAGREFGDEGLVDLQFTKRHVE